MEQLHRDVVYGAISYEGGKLFLTYGSTKVFCIDSKKGSILWKVDLGQKVRSRPIIQNGKVVVQTLSNDIFVLNRESGGILWSVQAHSSVAKTMSINEVAVIDDRVFFIDNDFLNCFSLSSGQGIFQLDLKFSGIVDGLYKSLNLNLGGGAIKIDSSDRSIMYIRSSSAIYALKLGEGGKNASVLWSLKYISQTGLSECGDVLYFIDITNNLICVDKHTGAIILLLNINDQIMESKSIRDWWSPIPVKNGLMLFSNLGDFGFFNFKLQKTTWYKKLDYRIVTDPIIRDQKIYLICRDTDYLYMIS